MRKRIPLMPLVLFFLLAGQAPGDVAAQFQQAEQLTDESKYEQAESIYSQIATERLCTADGLRAQQKLTALYVAWGKQTDAQASLDNLLAQYSQHELLPEAVTKVGDAYRKAQSYAKAAEIHHYVVDRWPNNEFAFWSQMDLVICSEALRDVAGTQAAFEKLCTQYSGHQLMPKAICFLGDDYRRRGQHARALELYGQVLSKWPNAEDALWSQMGLAISNILVGNMPAADTAAEKLHTDFSKDGRISIAACLIGDEYRKSGQYAKACELYRYVLDNHPASEHAFWSQMNLVISNIQLARNDLAEKALERLLAYSDKGDDRLPFAIRTLADEFRGVERYEKAFELYERVVRDYPDTKDALWSQMNIAIANIRLKQDESAKAAISKLLTKFDKDSDIPVALCWVADQYRGSGRHADACLLYQRIVDNWPDAEHAMWSQLNIVISQTALQDDAAASAAIEKLYTQFSDQPQFPSAVFQIGEIYYMQAFAKEKEGHTDQARELRLKAIARWKQIVTELPRSPTHTRAHIFAADCYSRLGQYQKAIDQYGALLDGWPDYEYAWDALLLMGRAYQDLKEQGGLSESQADTRTMEIYQQLLAKYPDSKAAPIAKRWLSRHVTN